MAYFKYTNSHSSDEGTTIEGANVGIRASMGERYGVKGELKEDEDEKGHAIQCEAVAIA